jgi:hypothetical protein
MIIFKVSNTRHSIPSPAMRNPPPSTSKYNDPALDFGMIFFY